jgi:hypothetical protein
MQIDTVCKNSSLINLWYMASYCKKESSQLFVRYMLLILMHMIVCAHWLKQYSTLIQCLGVHPSQLCLLTLLTLLTLCIDVHFSSLFLYCRHHKIHWIWIYVSWHIFAYSLKATTVFLFQLFQGRLFTYTMKRIVDLRESIASYSLVYIKQNVLKGI